MRGFAQTTRLLPLTNHLTLIIHPPIQLKSQLRWKNTLGPILIKMDLKSGHKLFVKKVVFTLQNWTEHLQDTFLRAYR